jgi:hypothetical protein
MEFFFLLCFKENGSARPMCQILLKQATYLVSLVVHRIKISQEEGVHIVHRLLKCCVVSC